MATGHIINQHYHWETHDGKQIFWGDSQSWVIESNSGVFAVYVGDYDQWTNTPPVEQSMWDIYSSEGGTVVEGWIDMYCDTCAPTPSPTTSPTKYPTTPIPTLSPSVFPSPAPSPAPSVIPTPSPTALPTTLTPSNSPSSMPSPSPTLIPLVQ